MEDRLTNLPVELQLRILSFLETKQAVQTSLLSKTWISLWTLIPVLEFNCTANYPNLNAFDRFVCKVLCLLHDRSAKPNLDRLTYFRIPPLRRGDKILKAVFDYAISHGVKELAVRIGESRSDTWPDFSSESLKRLVLRSHTIASLKCPFLGQRSGSFKNLTFLYLVSPRITDEEPFSGFPVLQKLALINSDIRTEGKNLNLNAPNLASLIISVYQTFNRFVLTTPRLTYFRYQGSEFPDLITPAGLPVLHTVVIGDNVTNTFMPEKRVFDDLVSMFCALSNARSLTFFTSVVDILSLYQRYLVNKTSTFLKLKCLKLDFKDQYYHTYFNCSRKRKFFELRPHVKAYFLHNSPHAKVTVIS